MRRRRRLSLSLSLPICNPNYGPAADLSDRCQCRRLGFLQEVAPCECICRTVTELPALASVEAVTKRDAPSDRAAPLRRPHDAALTLEDVSRSLSQVA